MANYNPMTSEDARELAGIVGEAHVVWRDAEKLEACSHDETPDRRWARMPEAVAHPRTAGEIAAIMKLANRRLIPVTPRGAGSGLSGGAVPLHGGIVLHLDRMDRILEIDRENMMAVVEPGVVTNEINEALRPAGLFYPGYPMSLETCHIGGNVAENAGGAKAVKYGVTGRYVLGLEVVTPTGDVVQLGGKRVKDVTGYDLVQLMVGSEGTLGIFTRITLRLMPLVKASADLLCVFRSVGEAIRAVPRMMTQGAVIPAAVEFMDRDSLRAACEYLNEPPAAPDAEAMLLVTVEGASAEAVERDYDALGREALAAGAIEVFVADNRTTSERVWRIRRNISEALSLISRNQSNEDIVVPIAAIPQLVDGLRALSRKWGLFMPCFGHAGDGNMHVRIVMDPAWTMERWNETLPQALRELYLLTASLGGTISGEHGIGHKRKAYVPLVLSEPHLNMMRAIKRGLDPNNVLNPGKKFDV
jgi:glycolate oxidase